MNNNFDIGIIGAGPAGYTYALHASAQGKSVVLFEKDQIGGVCLNKGCIPTKSILHSSEVYKQILIADKFGVTAQNVTLDYSKVLERKNKTVESLRKGIELALKNAKVTLINSEAKIKDKNTIECNADIYNCSKIVCATGSSPKVVKGLEFDHEFLLSSDDILNLASLPKSILIVGSGAIGVEWARIFNNFGVETTVVELASHLLPLADTEVSKRLERIFKAEKIKFFTQTCVKEINNKKITLSNDEILQPEMVLVAVGRTPNITDKIDGVTYIGDVTGEIQLAHYAIKQAIEDTDGIKFENDLTPSVVYGTPEIAWVGKREQDLEPDSYKKSLVLLSAIGKAHCDGQTDGLIKILSQNGKIVGAHIVSSEASSLIQQITIAIQNGITVDKLKEVCFPHPTYSEGIFDALFKL
ncbi:FAD-dependent oxidoreductase [bacterium]|nr:FAD-dependent oxidoreductase [bacterium]